ncbi:MAG: thioesterase family protein [Terriglobia bacterium]
MSAPLIVFYMGQVNMARKKKELRRGARQTLIRAVEFRRTIAHYDRRLPPVLSTPSMIGQMEVTAAKLLQRFLPRGAISVGTHINVSHQAAALVGERLRTTAVFQRIRKEPGKRPRYVFAVEARVGKRLIGEGFVERVAVNHPGFSASARRRRKKRR